MKKYIVFLRGVNVGGKNKIPMSELKTTFEQNGFSDVKTYINSGNIICSSEIDKEEIIKRECEMLILTQFQLNIPVAVISAADLVEAICHAPGWWNHDKESKHNAIFVIPPLSVDEAFLQVGEIKAEYEKVDSYGSVIFWSAPKKTFSKTRWSKVSGTSVYGNITIRNANTANKLAELVQ